MSTLILTGAGISLASGIPTFRGSDPGAVWANDVMAKGTLAYFQRDPAASWQWYLSRFEKYADARPNAAHVALAEWERKKRTGEFLLVTQNVDTLHEQAGSRELVKVHGSRDQVRCTRRGCAQGAPNHTILFRREDFDAFRAAPKFENLPRCSICRSLLRPHVLWFDEYYADHVTYQWELVQGWAGERASEVWFIGTSMAVTVADVLYKNARDRGIPIHVVNPADAPLAGVTHHRESAETWLPGYVRTLPGPA